MKIATASIAISAALLALVTCASLAEAGRRADCRDGAPCYKGNYVRPYAENGWFNFRFFGDFSGPCGPLLRKAIEIDTPDPRYWNAYGASACDVMVPSSLEVARPSQCDRHVKEP